MKRMFTGGVIILAGILVLFANVNAFSLGDAMTRWWPLFVIGAGLLMLLNDSKSYVWGLFVVVLGVAFLVNSLGIVKLNVGDLIVPGILIAIGASMISRSRRDTTMQSQRPEEDITAIMGGGSHKNTTADYKGGKVTAVMGGAEIDLSKAVIKKTAVMDIFAFMGGVELRVPENVIVKSRATMVLGGIEDKTRPKESKDAPVLHVDGTVIMGGIEIKR